MRTSMNRAETVWFHLLEGRSLDSLELPTRNGRTIIAGLDASSLMGAGLDRFKIGRGWELASINWKDLEFTNCNLRGLRMKDCAVVNCDFVETKCSEWRVWNCEFQRVSFLRCDLTRGSLAPLSGTLFNRFRDVEFSRSDLRETSYVAAEMTTCRFLYAKLDGVDFGGVAFNSCVFSGELNHVVFNGRIPGKQHPTPSLPKNTMNSADFTDAKLRLVMFNNLSMTEVRWPADGEHMFFLDLAGALDALVFAWRDEPDANKRGLAAVYAKMRSHVPPGGQGVISRDDIRTAAGESALLLAESVLERSSLLRVN